MRQVLLSGVVIHLNLKIVLSSFPSFPVSRNRIYIYIYVFFLPLRNFALLHLHTIHLHLLLSTCPRSLSLSGALDGNLSCCRNHYSNFLCNMNDSEAIYYLSKNCSLLPSPLHTHRGQPLTATPDITLLRGRGCNESFWYNVLIGCDAWNGWVY